MPNMAPMTAYQGSKMMKRMKEGSAADEREDRRTGENTKADRERPAKRKKASKTILASHKKPRIY